MSTERRLTIVRLSRAVYAGLLIFYPTDLRRKFGAEMADVFELNRPVRVARSAVRA